MRRLWCRIFGHRLPEWEEAKRLPRGRALTCKRCNLDVVASLTHGRSVYR